MNPATHYRCARCGAVYPKGWTDEEALQEYKATFPDTQADPTELVCDACYTAFMLWCGRKPVME